MRRLRRNARLKDDILRRISDETQKKTDIYSLASDTKQDVNLIAYLAEELEKEGHAKLLIVTIKGGTDVPNEYIVQPTNRGIHFLRFDGGYLGLYRKGYKERSWQSIKGIAALFNAIAILVLAAYGIYVSDRTNKLEAENEELKSKQKARQIERRVPSDSLMQVPTRK